MQKQSAARFHPAPRLLRMLVYHTPILAELQPLKHPSHYKGVHFRSLIHSSYNAASSRISFLSRWNTPIAAASFSFSCENTSA